MWRFPLTFSATEPDADDLIIVEALGLNVQSSVGFKLYSPVKSVRVALPATHKQWLMTCCVVIYMIFS